MVLLKLIFTFVLCVLFDLYCCLELGNFTIYRKKNQNGDRFVIQRETCSQGIPASNCSFYGAYPSNKNPCECTCPSSNATFTYRDGLSRCIDDGIIMKTEGRQSVTIFYVHSVLILSSLSCLHFVLCLCICQSILKT